MAESRTTHADKLAEILRQAAAVFAEKGYHRASIRDISRATGVSLSGLYYYVKSKEELLYAIQDHCFGAVMENAERLLAGEEDPARRLRLFVENHLRFFVNNMQEMKVLSHEAEALTGDYRDRVNAKKRRYTELCMGILRALAPGDSRVDLRVATFGLFGMLNWIYNWYHPGRDVPVEELAEDMSAVFLRGYVAAAACVSDTAEAAVPGSSRPDIWRR